MGGGGGGIQLCSDISRGEFYYENIVAIFRGMAGGGGLLAKATL